MFKCYEEGQETEGLMVK